MSREIKFRIWDKSANEMSLPEDNDRYWIHPNGLVKYYDVWCTQDVVLMQFTGLLDKNGKEIYEEDIVKIYFSDYKFEKKLIEYGQFRNCNCCDNVCGIGFDIGIHFESDTIEIIGNIFENPELLEKVDA